MDTTFDTKGKIRAKSISRNHRFARLALFFLVVLFQLNSQFAQGVFACTEDPSVKLMDIQEPDGVDVCVQPNAALDATITVDLKLDNLVSSAGPDFTCDLHTYTQRNNPYGLTHLHVVDAKKPYHFNYDFHYRIGNLNGHPDPNYAYDLPYQQGSHYRIAQGYFGNFSHQRGTDSEYAIDFDMPMGTVVCAAREGIVVSVRTDSTEGGPFPTFLKCANHVDIRHSDGSYAEYVHLQTNGSLVKVGEHVAVGQPIAYSGATGFAQGPHLHFAVYIPRDGFKIQSVPTHFRVAGQVVNQLMEGQVY